MCPHHNGISVTKRGGDGWVEEETGRRAGSGSRARRKVGSDGGERFAAVSANLPPVLCVRWIET